MNEHVEELTTTGVVSPRQVTKSQLGRDVAAVMTMPRLAFTDNLFCAMEGILPLGIVLEKGGGVFWGQALTNLMKRHLDDGTKYILTLDYDTIFQKEDVLLLYDIMERRSDIDALCAVQMRREENSILITFRDAQGNKVQRISTAEFQGETTPVATAHFGLTMLRVSTLREIPKPWFRSIPDEEGEWGSNRVDEDVAFWHKWKASGRTLHMANRVHVGHMELVINWTGPSWNATYQHLRDYRDNGKPKTGIWT